MPRSAAIESGAEDLRGRTVFTLHPHQNLFNLPASAAMVLPENLPPRRAVLAANMETALNAVWDAAPGPADRIAIVGAGVVGALVAYLCGRLPGAEVTLIDINPARAELADILGVGFAKPEAAKGDCDLVVHCSGHPAGLDTALALAGRVLDAFPVTTVAAKRASIRQLLKLWGGTLVGNLAGGWLLMWLIMTGFPKLHAQTIESASHYVDAPLSAETLTLSLLGGMAITLMTRMQHGTDSVFGKIAAAVAGAFLLAGLQMFHSILDSLLIFGALSTGDAPFGYADWVQWFGYTIVGNMVGGLLLVTLLRLLRSKDRLQEERDNAEESES